MLQPHLYYAEQPGPLERGTDVAVPAEPVPCVVTAVFHDGYTADALALATAWTSVAVDARFRHPDPAARGGGYKVWVPLHRVWREN